MYISFSISVDLGVYMNKVDSSLKQYFHYYFYRVDKQLSSGFARKVVEQVNKLLTSSFPA